MVASRTLLVSVGLGSKKDPQQASRLTLSPCSLLTHAPAERPKNCITDKLHLGHDTSLRITDAAQLPLFTPITRPTEGPWQRQSKNINTF